LRVGEAVRHALSELLLRRELRDPALVDKSVTVSEVRVSPDMRNATAYICPLGGDDVETVLAGLTRAAPHLNGQIASMVRLRNAPRLTFVADPTFDQAEQIDRVLRAPSVARDLTDNTETESRDDS
jgi:ribosome-binding factor A